MTARRRRKASPLPTTEAGLVYVYPSNELLARVDGAHLPHVGIAGGEVPAETADEWIAQGLASLEPPTLPAVDEPTESPDLPAEES